MLFFNIKLFLESLNTLTRAVQRVSWVPWSQRCDASNRYMWTRWRFWWHDFSTQGYKCCFWQRKYEKTRLPNTNNSRTSWVNGYREYEALRIVVSVSYGLLNTNTCQRWKMEKKSEISPRRWRRGEISDFFSWFFIFRAAPLIPSSSPPPSFLSIPLAISPNCF